jgi:hypothetical protein
MKKIKILLFVSAFSLFFTACEKDADVKLPKVEPKLVLTTFLSPQDTSILVYVKKTRPIFESYDSYTTDAVENATVIISDGTSSANLSFDPNGASGYTHGNYKISSSLFPISANKTYTITASTPDGKIATGFATVPSFANVNFAADVTITTIDSNSTSYNRNYDFNFSWDDIAGSATTYKIIAKRVSFNTLGIDTFYRYSTYIDDFVNDEGKDGQRLTYKGQYSESGYSSIGFGNTDTLLGYDYYIFNVSDSYYQYNTTAVKVGFDSGDPFAEPVLIYSNVTGGLGAVCAYNELARIIKR